MCKQPARNRLVRLLLRRPASLCGLVILCLLGLTAILTPVLTPFDPYAVEPAARLRPPGTPHLFGTDHFGRDILSRTLYGARLSFLMGASVTVYSLLFGLIVGSLASYYKNLRIVLMRLVDVLMSFPSILLALALMAIFGRGSFFSVVLSVGTVHAPRAARIVFGSALSILEEEYIAAAHALGASDWHIITRHVLRNLVSPVIVQGSYIFAVSIVEVAALDFLGVGMPPYIASWGGMMNEGRIYITSAPWIIGFPGLFLAVTVLAVNLLGDALRDVLDPRLRGLL